MVFVPYPRHDLISDQDLIAYIKKENHKGDNPWVILRDFLKNHLRFELETIIYKCWYTELYQSDKNAQDVEHFRPKNSSKPINDKNLKEIKETYKIDIQQANDIGDYKWLKLDYNNYRLVTALPNRGGGKVDLFPLAAGSTKLIENQLPWDSNQNEFPLLLDPCVKSDTKWLFVIPDGRIKPSVVYLSVDHTLLDKLSKYWTSDTTGYVRSAVSIVIYNLNKPNIIEKRKKIYDETMEAIINLAETIHLNLLESGLMKRSIQTLYLRCLPSAEFALASRCAMKQHILDDQQFNEATRVKVAATLAKILAQVDKTVNAIETTWQPRNPPS